MSTKLFLTALFVFVSGIFLAGCSSNQGAKGSSIISQTQAGQGSDSGTTNSDTANSTKSLTGRDVRSDNGEGGVQVTAEWVTPEYAEAAGENDQVKKYDLNKNIIIKIQMTTHMGDLTKYPILNNARLTVNEKVIKPASWDILSNTAHHPQGYLVFPAKAELNGNGSKLQLNLEELNGIPDRKFSW